MGRNDYLIKRKFFSYLIPGVLLVVAMQLGNIVDGILVSHLLDLDGMTAITLSMPVILFLQLAGFIISTGGPALASVELGKRNVEKASGIFSVSLLAGFVISAVLAATAPFISHPLAQLLASTDRLRELLEPYILVNIACIPILNLIMITVNFIRIDNSPNLAAAAFIIANVVNLILDYVLLKFTTLGMYGASMSTMIGYACGFVVLIPYIMSKNRMLKPKLRGIAQGIKELPSICKSGMAQGSMLLMQILQFFILNTMIQNALGADKMSIYAICLNSVDIVRLFIAGVIGVIQTIAGVLYGERDYFGIKKLVGKVVRATAVITAALIALFMAAPGVVLQLYSFNRPELFDVAANCVRLFSLSFIFYAVNFFIQTYSQTILRPFISTLNTVLEGFVFLIPLSIGLTFAFDIYGVCMAYALTELFAFAVTDIYRRIRQKQGRLPQKGMLMIPDADPESLCDITVHGSVDDAVNTSKELIERCTERGIDRTKADIIGIAVEEIITNITFYGKQEYRYSYIDINLCETDTKLILRIRDDGVPFNPTEYKAEDDGFLISGISTIKSISDKFTYIRALNLNNTVIELNK